MVLSFTGSEEDSSLTCLVILNVYKHIKHFYFFFVIKKSIYHKLKFKKWLVEKKSNQHMGYTCENQQVSRLIRTGPVKLYNYVCS